MNTQNDPLLGADNIAVLTWSRFGRFLTRRWVILSPQDPVLFSERNGYRKPVLSVRGWRIIAAVEMGDYENIGYVA